MEFKSIKITLANPEWCNGCRFLDNYPSGSKKPITARCVMGYWNQRGEIQPAMHKLMDWKITRPEQCKKDAEPLKGYDTQIRHTEYASGSKSEIQKQLDDIVNLAIDSINETVPAKIEIKEPKTYTREDYKKEQNKKSKTNRKVKKK